MKKIIIIQPFPFAKRFWKYYGLNKLKIKFKIELWNIAKVFVKNKNEYRKWIFDKFDYNWINTIYFENKNDIIKKLQNDLNSTLIVNMRLNIKTMFIFKFLSKKKKDYYYLWADPVPSFLNRKNLLNILSNIYLLFNYNNVINFILQKVNLVRKNIFWIQDCKNLLITWWSKWLSNNSLVGLNTNKIWIHSFDYEFYLQNLLEKWKGNKNDYIVFVDQNFAFHADFKKFNSWAPVTKNNYYKSLNKLFKFLEMAYNKKIIIAAHQTFDIKMAYLFEWRKVVQNDTISYVKNSFFNIIHNSTAIKLVIIYNKPFVQITTNEIENHIYGKYIKNLNINNFNSKKIINIDDKYNKNIINNEISNINNAEYSKFFKQYIKNSNSKDIQFYKIISNLLK